MHNFIKRKSSRRLCNISRYKRNGRIRSSISFIKKKIDLNPVIVYKQHSHYLRHIDFSSFSFEPFLSYSLSIQKENEIDKKKYYLGSFVFSSPCHYSRKRSTRFLDDEIMRTHHTIPYRSSLTKFSTYRILRSHSTITTRALSLLRKRILSKSSNIHGSFVRRLSLRIEERSDNTLLRLFRFKSLFTIKRSPMRKKVKSPRKNYSVLQIRQQPNHGRFLIDGKKITTGNRKVKPLDTVSFSRSFLSNPYWSDSKSFFSQLNGRSKFSHLILSNHSYSISSDMEFRRNASKPILSEINFLCQHLKNFHLKRFTEIHSPTYKNFHLFSRLNCTSFIETLIKPFITSFSSGTNQSLSSLWPLLSLLSFRTSPSIQRTLLNTNSSTSRGTLLQKNLHDLFILKKFQNRFFTTSAPSTSSSPDHFLVLSTLHPSLSSVESLSCHASVLYGTRKCKWVNLQQRRDSFFYSNFYNKVGYFELELDFFQLSLRLSSFASQFSLVRS